MYEGYIYCITNNVNGKKYIGQTKTDILTRWRGHKSDATNPNAQKFAIHLAMNKYGIENFIIKEIQKYTTYTLKELSKILNDKERFYIKKYQTIAPNGYNLTEGGGSGNINDLKEVCQYNMFGNFINEYKSITEAAIMTNGNHKAISSCCMHHLKTSGGFVWEYKGVSPRIIYSIKDSSYKVDQYSLDGVFIKTFENATIASQEVNALVGNIRSVCTGYSKTAKGYVWRKHGDAFDKYDVISKIRNIEHIINQYDFEGNLIAIYDEYTKLPDYVMNQNVVYDCCRGKCKYAYNYIWTFDDDTPDIQNIPDSQKPLYQYDLNGKFIKKFCNIYEVANVLHIDKSGILNCIQGRNDSAYGFIWSTVFISNMKPYHFKNSKYISKYDYNGNFIEKYSSITESLKKSTIKKAESIINCCKGKIEYTKDGIWRYEDEAFDKYPLHKYCILDTSQNIIYSSIFQKDLAEYLNVDFRTISAFIKNEKNYKNLYFKTVDVNNKSA